MFAGHDGFRRLSLALGVCVALLAAAHVDPGHADIIRVPADVPTIGDAIAAAVADDEILVAAGTYELDATITVPLTLRGEDGPTSTIVTGDGSHRHLVIEADTVIEGLTFENGGDGNDVASSTFFGGSVYVASASVSLDIDDCVFRDSKAGSGGAVYSAGPLTLNNSTFTGNGNGQTWPAPGLAAGGAVFTETDLVIDGCTFEENRSALGGAVRRIGPTTVTNSTFRANYSNGLGGGIGTPATISGITIENCTFVENFASRGGGAYLVGGTASVVRDCEFLDNDAGAGGGGLYASGEGGLLVENCDFIGNEMTTTGAQGGGAVVVNFLRGGTTFQSCFFQNNICPNLEPSIGGGAVWIQEEAGDISPRFFDTTFVDNEARNGAAVLVVWNGDGGDRPLFERCVFGHNVGNTTIACGRAGSNPSNYDIRCSLFSDNGSNSICGDADEDVFVVDEDEENQVFCDDSHSSVCADSPAWNQPCGRMGGLPECAACITPIERLRWGHVKAQFRTSGG